MLRKLLVAVAVLALAGCATMNTILGPSPEAQIKRGADALTATTVLASVLLKNDKITVSQARSYRVVLGAASSALDDANATLVACRKATGSMQGASPDPCYPGVADVIGIALGGIASVKKTLDSK